MKYLLLCALLYPFVTGAAAINVFMLALMGRAIGLPSLNPEQALGLGAVLSLGLTILAANWVLRLTREE